MLNIVILPDNLNKICVGIWTLLLDFPNPVLLRSSNFTSGGISSGFYLRRKEIKKTLNPSRMFHIIFWFAFLSSLYFKHYFANNPFLEYLDSLANLTFLSMSSPVVEWWCAYCTLLFDDSRHDRIILVAGYFKLYLWIITRL